MLIPFHKVLSNIRYSRLHLSAALYVLNASWITYKASCFSLTQNPDLKKQKFEFLPVTQTIVCVFLQLPCVVF